jgi:hypothetical protein
MTIMLKLFNTEIIFCELTDEDDDSICIVNTVELTTIETPEIHSLFFKEYIPFGLTEKIRISKDDIMFIHEPAPILIDMYKDKLQEINEMNILMHRNYYKDKKSINKHLN